VVFFIGQPVFSAKAQGRKGISVATGRMPRTAPMRHCEKWSADLRIGTNKQFPANHAESEFGVPVVVSVCARCDFVSLRLCVKKALKNRKKTALPPAGEYEMLFEQP
jgi:hypothetical protein